MEVVGADQICVLTDAPATTPMEQEGYDLFHQCLLNDLDRSTEYALMAVEAWQECGAAWSPEQHAELHDAVFEWMRGVTEMNPLMEAANAVADQRSRQT